MAEYMKRFLEWTTRCFMRNILWSKSEFQVTKNGYIWRTEFDGTLKGCRQITKRLKVNTNGTCYNGGRQ